MDKKFIDGLIIKAPNDNAPDFVKAKGSMKREELITWLSQQSGEWINFDVKVSKKGNWYAEVDTWQPKEKIENDRRMTPEEVSAVINSGNDQSDLPF